MTRGRVEIQPSRELLKRLSRNVRERRKARGWSQKEFARRFGVHGVHYTLIARIEQCRINITIGTLEQLAKALGVSAHDLLKP